MRYESTKYHKINTHSFRAYFITKVSRHDPNIAKMFAGQKIYMGQYDRLTAEEKLEKYIEFESDLYIFKQKPKSEEILDLTKKITELEKQASDHQIVMEYIRQNRIKDAEKLEPQKDKYERYNQN